MFWVAAGMFWGVDEYFGWLLEYLWELLQCLGS